jgi:hypothetical protein
MDSAPELPAFSLAVTLGATNGPSPAMRLKACQGCSAAVFRDNTPASLPAFVIGSLSGRFQRRDGSIGARPLPTRVMRGSNDRLSLNPANSGIDCQRRARGLADFVGRRRHHSRRASHRPQLQIQLLEFGIHHRCLQTTRSRPVPLITASRSRFIAVSLSAMDATMPSMKEEFATCRS